MEIYEKLKEEIQASLLRQSQAKGDSKVHWNLFIKDLHNLIITNYDESPLNYYKEAWEQAFEKAASDLSLNYEFEECEDRDRWGDLVAQFINYIVVTPRSEIISSSSISSSTPDYRRKLINVDYDNIARNYEKINKKWTLTSGRKVEDIMFKALNEIREEHISHSFIMYIDDPIWVKAMSKDEIDEVEAKQAKLNAPFPQESIDMLMKLNRKTTFSDIYDALDTVSTHPIHDPVKYWLKQSIINFAMLFKNNGSLYEPRHRFKIIFEVVDFIKKSCEMSGLSVSYSAKLTDTYTKSTKGPPAEDRGIRDADIYFVQDRQRLFCLEICNEDETILDTYINIPVLMKNFCCQVISEYKMRPDNLKTAGIIIDGLEIMGMVMTFDNGSVSLISATKKYRIPRSASEIPSLLPPILHLVYNLNLHLKDTVKEMDKWNSRFTLGTKDESFYFPPSFESTISSYMNGKRKFDDMEQ